MSSLDNTNNREWIVKLLIKVDAESPRLAVDAFIQNIINFGLSSWTYTADDTEIIYAIRGDGEIISITPAESYSPQKARELLERENERDADDPPGEDE